MVFTPVRSPRPVASKASSPRPGKGDTGGPGTGGTGTSFSLRKLLGLLPILAISAGLLVLLHLRVHQQDAIYAGGDGGGSSMGSSSGSDQNSMHISADNAEAGLLATLHQQRSRGEGRSPPAPLIQERTSNTINTNTTTSTGTPTHRPTASTTSSPTVAASADKVKATANDKVSTVDIPGYAAATCRKSWDPVCDMYGYVRFWNKEIEAQDCYKSPAAHPLGAKAPVVERRYLVFEPDRGGWNNIRMAAETAMIFAHASGRILVMPPEEHWYLLQANSNHEENHSEFEDFFQLEKIAENLEIISMEEFLTQTAAAGLLKKPFPGTAQGNRWRGYSVEQFVRDGVDNRGNDGLWGYLKEACYVRQWEPGKIHIGFNLVLKPDQPKSLRARYDVNDYVDFQQFPRAQGERQRLHSSHGRTLVPYDANLHAERAIFFPGGYNVSTRILTHFYTYMFWQDHHLEHVYKRMVRDRLHYHDDIFCAAGKIIRLIHEEAALLSQNSPYESHRYSAPDAETNRDEQTTGGNIHQDATYIAYHIRRGDFQYKDMIISAKEVYANTKHLLHPNRTAIIYISTDHKNTNFFNPMKGNIGDYPGVYSYDGAVFQLRFLKNYLRKAGLEKANQNHIGMIEQIICANAHTFFGTPLSSFSGYVTRMRGYYRDGRYDRTYYTKTSHLYTLHSQKEIIGPFWAREFSVAHSEIDDDDGEYGGEDDGDINEDDKETESDDNVSVTFESGVNRNAPGSAKKHSRHDDDLSQRDHASMQKDIEKLVKAKGKHM